MVAIRPTRSLLGSPALSRERFAIERASGAIAVMISPDDRAGFLAAMAAATGMMREGEALVRR
jgi:hypothetical protein